MDLVGIKEGYLLTANYKSYQDKSGNQKTNSNGTSLLALRINSRGQLISELAMPSDQSFYITDVVKASDSNINLLGYKGAIEEYDGNGLKFDRNLIHIIIDGYNNVVSSSLD